MDKHNYKMDKNTKARCYRLEILDKKIIKCIKTGVPVEIINYMRTRRDKLLSEILKKGKNVQKETK